MKRNLSRSLLLVAFVLVLAAASWWLPLADMLESIVRFRETSPVAAVLVYVVVSATLTVLLTPGWMIMMLGGLMFGFIQGLIITSLATTTGALAAFLVGRTLARDWVREQIRANRKMRALDIAVGQQAFRIVLLTRIALVLPFNLLNYVYGATRASTLTYILATAIGMLPAVSMYVYLGSLSNDLGQIMSSERSLDASTVAVAAVAIVAIAVVFRVIQKAANDILEKQLEKDE